MTEYPLFITDPADQTRKMVGTKQVHDDGRYTWFRRLGAAHVMRIGKFGVDATTYDVQFRGKAGAIRIEHGDVVYEVPFEVFDKHCTTNDYGHGRQYFLPFSYWAVSNKKVTPIRSDEPPAPKAKPVTKAIWGETKVCYSCKGKGKTPHGPCKICQGTGLVAG